jgi:uracil-DNA glycosylase
VGRLAIERFLPKLPLDQLIGREHRVMHAGGSSVAIPLPHPSGASSWIHLDDHSQLLDRSLAMIGHELERLAITGSGKRGAA